MKSFTNSLYFSAPRVAERTAFAHLLKFADNNRGALPVMGTAGRSRIPGFHLGDAAEGIFDRANCPVLAVKPRGFESPVTRGSAS